MRVIFEDEKKRISLKNGTAVALGNFDGIHIAHLKLIKKLKEEAEKRNLKTVVYTFAKHPENVLANRIFTLQIMSNSQKIKYFEKLNIDYLYFARFTEKMSEMEPEYFIEKVLISKFKAKLIVVGEDYRFGARARGNIDILKKLAKKYNIEVIVIPQMKYEGEELSSTRIRREIIRGNIENANHLLGRVYEIETKTYEFPIAYELKEYNAINSIADSYLIVPKYGVYITRVTINGHIYNTVTIIKEMRNPDDTKRVILQTNIPQFDYGKTMIPNILDIKFYKKIRNYKETAFDIEKTKKQMKLDVKLVENYFNPKDKKM